MINHYLFKNHKANSRETNQSEQCPDIALPSAIPGSLRMSPPSHPHHLPNQKHRSNSKPLPGETRGKRPFEICAKYIIVGGMGGWV